MRQQTVCRIVYTPSGEGPLRSAQTHRRASAIGACSSVRTSYLKERASFMPTRTIRKIWHLGLWILLIAVTTLGGGASAQSRPGFGSRITVYADIDFAGQSRTFDGVTPDMVSAGWNDNISSIRVPNGQTWEICVDANYGNQCQAVTGDVADLRTMGWNDRISSLRRINDGDARDRRWDGRNTRDDRDAGVTVYANTNFGGRSASFNADTPNMVSAGWNDTISSIRIANGETWEICQDVDYGNQCRAISGDVADLRSMGWDDRISSLRRTDINGAGNRRFGRGNGNRNNRSAGVTVYANANYRGQSALLRNDTPNLTQFNLNDMVSSIRVSSTTSSDGRTTHHQRRSPTSAMCSRADHQPLPRPLSRRTRSVRERPTSSSKATAFRRLPSVSTGTPANGGRSTTQTRTSSRIRI